jgi:hypothetical protein
MRPPQQVRSLSIRLLGKCTQFFIEGFLKYCEEFKVVVVQSEPKEIRKNSSVDSFFNFKVWAAAGYSQK